MNQSNADLGDSSSGPPTPDCYVFRDEQPKQCTYYKLLINSEKGREYENLQTDSERLQYMILNADAKTIDQYPDAFFFYDRDASMMYEIEIGTKEATDYQELSKEHGKSSEVVKEFFKKHAHNARKFGNRGDPYAAPSPSPEGSAPASPSTKD